MHADAFQSIADPTRRLILASLQQGEKRVGEIVERVGIHQSGVSRHLRILEEAGFVSMRADKQWRVYRLQREPFRELEAWLAPYRELWEARLDRFGQALIKQRTHQPPSKGKKR